MNLDAIRQQLQAIKETIAAANVTLGKGASVDLAALQNSVKTVCDQIDGLPRSVGTNEIEQLIKTIVTDFDALSEALTHQHQYLTADERLTSNIYPDDSSNANKDDENAGDN